ncbi:MAG: TolC family protein [Saprospiraceae bacterium]
MKTYKNYLFIIFSFLSSYLAIEAQKLSHISIVQCYVWAEENYPLIKQLSIMDKIAEYDIDNASKGYLPQMSINGQASYQSQVTELKLDLPNAGIPAINKDQYKIYGEIFQPLTNFSAIKSKQHQILLSTELQKQEVKVDLFKLRDRVNQLYFGILLSSTKIEQLKVLQTDIDSTIVKVEAASSHGIATSNDVKLLKVERLSLNQKIQESISTKTAYINVLATLINQNISTHTQFAIPKAPSLKLEINRPELKIFELQNESIILRKKDIYNKRIPDVGLFFQGGYGRPAFNFLSNQFDAFYITGVKINWNLSSIYTSSNERQIMNLNVDKINLKRENFILNTNLVKSQQVEEINKINILISTDIQIIDLRKSIKNTAEMQLTNGLITTLDYINYLNNEAIAQQNLILHETLLLLAQHNLKMTMGN